MSSSPDTTTVEPREIEIRHCHSLPEYETCVDLELRIWGEQIAVPSAIFVVAHHTGGQILGAFDDDKMVGFTLALVGTRSGKPFLHSHMTAVLPAYQNRGVGRRLKLFQRQDALKRDIRLVEWTFDPLELKNAHFNFVRLGAIAQRFIPDCYGITQSPLHAGLPTDRLVAEWWIDSDRVKNILQRIIRFRQRLTSNQSRCPPISTTSKRRTVQQRPACNPRPATSSKSCFIGDTSPLALSPAAQPPTTFWNLPLP